MWGIGEQGGCREASGSQGGAQRQAVLRHTGYGPPTPAVISHSRGAGIRVNPAHPQCARRCQRDPLEKDQAQVSPWHLVTETSQRAALLRGCRGAQTARLNSQDPHTAPENRCCYYSILWRRKLQLREIKYFIKRHAVMEAGFESRSACIQRHSEYTWSNWQHLRHLTFDAKLPV